MIYFAYSENKTKEYTYRIYILITQKYFVEDEPNYFCHKKAKFVYFTHQH